MPTRTVKRGGAASETGRTPRTTKRTEGQQQEASPVVEETVKAGEVAQDIVVIDEAKPTVEDKLIEEKLVIDEEREEEERSEAQVIASKESTPGTKEDDQKESVEDYERDERLDLGDSDPEYDPEGYDDKDLEQENVDDASLYREPDHEGHIVEMEEEEETDIVEEDLDEGQEEVEVEEEDKEDNLYDHAVEELAHEHLDVETEQHEVLKERRKHKEFEVFVCGLNNNATKVDLKEFFGVVGEVMEVRMIMNSQTKTNKGSAFLRFATIEQAKRAATELKHPVINGKECDVAPSQDSYTLFIWNICKAWTMEALKEKLKHYGVDNINDLTLIEDNNNANMNKGFAFLEFSSRADAKDALKKLQKRYISFGLDRPAKVSFADSFIDPGDEIMTQVKTVFIGSMPTSWDEDRVRKLLDKYGTIEKIELARNKRDFGFVTYDTHESAVLCAKSINYAEIGDGDSKAKARARLSRPLQRGNGKHVRRGYMPSSRCGSRVPGGSYRRPPPPPPPLPGTHSYPSRPMRSAGCRIPSNIVRGPMAVRDRPLPPRSRYYDRRAPAPSYPKSNMKREYARKEEILPPRSRAPPVDYGSRVIPERHVSYRKEYLLHGSDYADMPKSAPRSMARREHPNDGYSNRFDRRISYRESRTHDYDSASGSKRPYSTMDDVPPWYADPPHPRSRLDYDIDSSHHCSDGYVGRMGRSNMFSGSQSSMNSQDSHGMYSSRSMGYSGGPYSSGNVGRMYTPRESNGSSRSYSSSLYSIRGGGGSSYMGPGGSGSYY